MADEIIGSVGVEARLDYSDLGNDFDQAVSLAVSAGSTLADAIAAALQTPDSTGVTSAFQQVGDAAAASAEQLQLFGSAEESIPWADASGQLNLFTTELETFGARAEDAGSSSHSAAASVENLGDATKHAGEGAHEAGIHFGELSEAVLEASGIIFSLEKIKEFGEWILEVAADEQKFTVSMTALTGSSQAAAEALKHVEEFSFANALPVEEVEKVTQKMTALGFSVEQTERAMQAAANAARATGYDFETTSNAIDRMALSGMAAGRQLFALRLNTKDLADAMGVTEAAAKSAFKELDQSQRVEVLTLAMSKFAGVSQAAAQTLRGEWTNTQNQVRAVLAEMGTAIAPAAEAILSFVQSVVIPQISAIVKQWVEATQAVRDFAGATSSAIQSVIGPFSDFKTAVTDAVNAVPGLSTALSTLSNIYSYISTPIKVATRELQYFTAGLQAVTGVIPGAKTMHDALAVSIDHLRTSSTAAGLALVTSANSVDTAVGAIVAQQDKLATAVTVAKAAYDKLNEAFKTGTPLANGHAVTLQDVQRALANLTAATAAAATATELHADKTHGAVLAHREMQDAVRLLVDEIKLEFDSIKKVTEATAIANETLGTHLTTLDMFHIKIAAANVDLRLFADRLGETVEKGLNLESLGPIIHKTQQEIGGLRDEYDRLVRATLDQSPFAKLGQAFHTLGLTGIGAFDGVEKKSLIAFETIAKSAQTTLPEVEAAWAAVSGKVKNLAQTDIPSAIRIQDEYLQALQRTGAGVGQVMAEEQKLLQLRIQMHTQQGTSSNAEIVALTNLQMKTKALETETNFLGNTYKALMKDFDDAFTHLGNNIAAGIVQGKSFGEVWHSTLQAIEQQILTTVINAILKLAESWLVTMIAGKAEASTAGVAEIMTSAAVGAAAAFASTAAIPIVGPLLAPEAAAAAYAAIAAFAPLAALAGGGIIPEDMIALVHKNEMVLPADISSGLKSMIQMGGSPELTNPAQFVGGVLSSPERPQSISTSAITVHMHQPRIGAGFTPGEVSSIMQEGIKQARDAGAFRIGVFPV